MNYRLLAVFVFLTGCTSAPPTWNEIRADLHRRYPAVKQITSQELADWLAATNRPAPLLLDCRSPEEFAVSHLRNAVLAGTTNPPADAIIVTYCSVGYRSTAHAAELQRTGHMNVQELTGSLFQWYNEGRPVYRGTNAVHEIHPYNTKWRHLLTR